MTTRSPADRAPAVLGRWGGSPLAGWRQRAPRGLLAALAAISLGAVLLALAPAFTIAAAEDGASTAPAFTAGPLLALLALVPAVLAWLLVGAARGGGAAGLLAGFALLAPGRAVLDLQLLAAPWQAARPELMVPTSLAPLRAGAGVWLLLAGHLLTMVAGVLALRAVPRVEPEGVQRAGATALTAALCGGVVAGVGLVLVPFRSTDAHLLPQSALDAPSLVAAGLLTLAGGAVLASCLAASAPEVDAGRGGLVGVALAVVAVALPPLAASAFAAPLQVAWGPLVALAGALALLGVVRLVRPVAAGSGPGGLEDQPVEVALPAAGRLHAAAGALAVATGLTALVGAVARQVTLPTGRAGSVLDSAGLLVPTGGAQPELLATRQLVPAGLLLVGLGLAMLLPRAAPLAAVVRPGLAVAWSGLVLVGAAVLDAALTLTQITGVRAGLGLWAVTVVLLAAPAVGVLTLLAGGAERDEADLGEIIPGRARLAVGAVAAMLAVPAFGLPLRTGSDRVPPGLWSHFGVASWGLLVAAAAVAVAALLAPYSRPPRAVALLLGAAAVLALHLAQVPLATARVGDSLGAGVWFGLACLAALLAGAGLAWRAASHTGRTRPRASTLRSGRGPHPRTR